jgi:6-phosphogluconolactonase
MARSCVFAILHRASATHTQPTNTADKRKLSRALLPVCALLACALASAMADTATCEQPLVFPNAAALASALGSFVVQASAEAVARHGQFVVAFSGGSLPVTLAAAMLPRRDEVDWKAWQVWFVDERHVPLTHADSNFKAVSDALLAHVPIPAANVHAIDASGSVEQAADSYEAALVQNAGRLDLVLLGMGPDGHIASLFPGHALLGEKIKRVAPISDSPKPPPGRITMTLPVINDARACAFVVTGASKADVVAQSAIPWEQVAGVPYPAALVRPRNGTLTWFLDADAAAKL